MNAARRPVTWLTALAVAAVVAVNAAGLWGIAVAYRGAREEAGRLFTAQTAARARSLESILASTRAELAFLAGSSAIAGLRTAQGSASGQQPEWRRLAAEAALLVFHRGHPEVSRLVVKSGKDDALVATTRRGGVPVLWMPQGRAADESPTAGDRPAVRAVFAFDQVTPPPRDVVRVVAEIDAAALLELGASGRPGTRCSLRDGAGRPLTPPLPREPPSGSRAEAPLRADGWSVPSPWTLTCERAQGPASALEPVARRSRTLLLLNLVIMGLAMVLGSFTVHEARRRERFEVMAREEARIRDLERQLSHVERLSTVGRLAAGIAHEINNPLEGIANYLSLARGALDRGEPAAAARHLEGVRQGLDRAALIVRRVLAHAEPTSAPPAPVDLAASVRETVDFVRSRSEFGSIDFVTELPEQPLVASGSGVMLGQVILNLVINACEAQPRGGEVCVSGRREADEVVVRVADRGPGISEAERSRVFEPFYTTKERSTGLGLSVCHSIVTQHKGRLAVDPRPGGGSVFSLRLPASEGGVHGG